MATPLSPDRLLATLRAEGCTVVEVGNWRTHNRNHVGAWGPVHGVMIHHTVTSGTANTVRICRDGYTSLPGPLCHGVIAKDGTVHLISAGRANHAGSGDSDVLQAVIAETALPPDNEANTDGNSRFYGFECENLGDGADPWPAVQLEAIERASAAICRVYGWGAESVIGHLEWQPGKVDPRGFSMASMRARIAARLSGTPTTPTDPKEPAVSAADELRRLIETDGVIDSPKDAADYATNKKWQWRTHIQDNTTRIRATQRAVDELAAVVARLETTGLTEAQMARIADLVADRLAARLAE